jgi:archaeosine synthase
MPVPAILAGDGGRSGVPSVRAGSPGEPARRSVTLSDGTAELGLEFAVAAPEVSGVAGAAERAAEGTWVAHWPLDAAQWTKLIEGRPELVVLGNARALLAEGEPFVQAIREVRERLGGRPVLWTPRVALPHRIALLTYLGIDLLDPTEVVWRSSEGAYFDLDSGTSEPERSPEQRWCECPACRTSGPPDRVSHGLALLESERKAVASALAVGRLRERVESRLASEPLLAELLRYADGHLAGLLDERTPVTGTGIHTYVLRESHRRPEIRRYQERLLTRYRPPPSKRVLLVVPCSKTKPYRNSRSHRRFRSAFEDLPGAGAIHVVSVTSPLGAVPRELEDVPPARHYDIPVTGDWDEGERRGVREALERILLAGAYERVIVHLDPDEYSFLRPVFPEALHPEWTMTDSKSTAAPAIARLRDATSDALAQVRDVPHAALPVVREELESLAGVQFGLEAARLLFEPPIRLFGRPWFQRITDAKGTDLATWREERGLFQLTVAGGTRMLPAHPLEVEVAPGVPIRGDLFVPGVLRADPAIRGGDAVLLTRDGGLLAVGEAELPGRLMTELDHGLAVTVRHRSHGTGPAPTPT